MIEPYGRDERFKDAEKLYGDVNGFNREDFETNYGKYFEDYDSTKEDYARKQYGAQAGGLSQQLGVSLNKIAQSTGQSNLAFSSSFGAAKNTTLDSYKNKLSSMRTGLDSAVHGFRDDHRQSQIDMMGDLAEEITNDYWGVQRPGYARSFGQDDGMGGDRDRTRNPEDDYNG
jgi:hypothetical protein